MKKTQRERIVKRHHHSVWMHGHSPQALFWLDQQVQEKRFDVLLGCGVKNGDTVLDVGCGFADLYDFMLKKGLSVDYTGVDISPDMIKKAQERLPALSFFVGDLFDFDPPEQSYDWVLLSGALNEPLQDNGQYVEAIIPRLYATCRKGLAFNLLNGDYDWSARELFTLHAYKPKDIKTVLDGLSDHVLVRTDYMKTDASFFVWRNIEDKPTL